jgi:hypothetical protein
VLYLLVVAVGTPLLLCAALLLDRFGGRRSAERHRTTLHVALLLGRHDEGLRLLAANAGRPDPWWTTTPPAELRQIDDALRSWTTVAGYIADRHVDRDVVLDVFGWRIVETWEQAFSYVEERHPELWEPLLELYVDAWQAGHPDAQVPRARVEAPAEPHAVTPEEVPEIDVVPAEVLAPLLTPAAPAPTDPPLPRVTQVRAALHRAMTPLIADTAPRLRSTAREADAPADLVIDLVGTPKATAVPRPVHR